MDAWGIIMTAITLFGMLVLTIAHCTMDSSSQSFGTTLDVPETDQADELKKAA